MASPAVATPPLLDFLKQLEQRLGKVKHSKAGEPILAISETHDSFLIDSIADANTYFTAAWPADKELDQQPLVDAFIALVTGAHKFDPKLQKVFDKLVPKKATELKFWRRYFAHMHALLYRLAPLAEEANYELVNKLPQPRPLEQRRYPPKEPLRMSGQIKRAEVISTLTAMAEVMKSDETITALGNEAEAGAADGTYPNLDIAAARVCMEYQLEYMEHLGIARLHGSLEMQPQTLAKRFPDMQGKDAPVFEALHGFITACNAAPAMAKQRLTQKPSDDPNARRFAPAAKLEQGSSFDEPKLIKLVSGIQKFVQSDETSRLLSKVSATAVEEAGGSHEKHALPMAQQKMMAQMARWQREYLESQGVPQDVGMRAVWGIPETFKPTPRKQKAGAEGGGSKQAEESPAGANELLQAFGSLRLSIQSALQGAMIEATKPETKPEAERRFPPKEGPLQTKGALERSLVLAFTRKCSEVLVSDESIVLLAASGNMQGIGNLSVSWQRELLEHLGVEMDHGCRALGEVPRLFQGDNEVLHAFQAFQQACSSSAEMARKKIISENVERERAQMAKTAEAAAAVDVQ